MAQSHFSLSWEQHRKNICHGLSSLQQNGEFVDMTLAADGYHVKVHQVIMALASPYIKDLIVSAQCQHPVILLNKVSYSTLSAILEYIYTGEVLVSVENLNELIEAGKELHITGLEDMKVHKALTKSQNTNEVYQENKENTMTEQVEETEMEFLEEQPSEIGETDSIHMNCDAEQETVIYNTIDGTREVPFEVSAVSFSSTQEADENEATNSTQTSDSNKNLTVMQYTVSNQGSLQMILNRFMYYLKHTNRNKTKQWRCVDYINSIKCPAYVITKDDMVVQRTLAHTHPFHDKKILKKVRSGAVFSAIQDAEIKGIDITITRNKSSCAIDDSQ